MSYTCLMNGCKHSHVETKLFETVSRAFSTEPSLLAVRTDHLEASYADRLAVLALDERQEVIGYTRLLPLLARDHPNGEWFELGSSWVRPDHRGRGVNRVMYELLLPAHRSKNILTTTTNPISVSVGKRLNLVTVPRRVLPLAVWQASCVCPAQKTGSCSQHNETCRFAWSEQQQSKGPCWFAITPETAQRQGLHSWIK